MKKILICAAFLVLIIQFGFQVYMANTDSQTTDEGVHLLAGYTYLTKHDYRFNPEHPPLVKYLAAFPLLFMKIDTSQVDSYWNKSNNFLYDSWQENRAAAEKFLYSSNNNADQILFFGRLPIVFLTLFLGILIFFIAYRFWGAYGAFVSTTLYAFDPNIMAHGHLITTDIGVTLGILSTLAMGWLFMKNPNRRNILLLGLILGIAELMKFTAIMLYPILIILLGWYIFSIKADWKLIKRYILSIISVFIISWVIIWAGYGFKTTLAPVVSNIAQATKNINDPSYVLPLTNTQTTLTDKTYNVIRYIMVPRDYFKGLFMVLTHVGSGHESYLLGQISRTGWWYYFPVLFSAKSTIPALALIFTSVYFVFKTKVKRNFYLLFGALLYLALAMTTKADLGLRHILPIYPILYILVGILTLQNIKWFKIAIPILLGLIFIEFLFVKPYYLSYFNQFYGGIWNGYNVATDSNYDWGQDLKKIKTYESDHPEIKTPVVSYYWDGIPSYSYYGINRVSDNELDDRVDYWIIGASARQSIIYGGDSGLKALSGFDYYDRVSPSVFVYKKK